MNDLDDIDEDTQDIAVRSGGMGGLALDDEILRGARRIVDEGTPENTKRAYRMDVAYIQAWARLKGIPEGLPMSIEAVTTFLVEHVQGIPYEVEAAMVAAGVKRDFGLPKISTLKRRMASLSVAHSLAGVSNPCEDPRVRDLLRRARRVAVAKGWSPRKKAAAALEVLERMLDTCADGTPHDVRDRALLLFAWSSGGRRRSEVAGATIERLELHGEDFVYRLGVTKTQHEEDTGVVPVAGRAAVAMRAWLEMLGRDEGPIFVGIQPDGSFLDKAMHPETVAIIVQRRASRAGLDAKRFAGHSMRSGFMTEAGLQGLDIREAMDMSMHSTMQIAAGYYQAGAGLKNRAARLAG